MIDFDRSGNALSKQKTDIQLQISFKDLDSKYSSKFFSTAPVTNVGHNSDVELVNKGFDLVPRNFFSSWVSSNSNSVVPLPQLLFPIPDSTNFDQSKNAISKKNANVQEQIRFNDLNAKNCSEPFPTDPLRNVDCNTDIELLDKDFDLVPGDLARSTQDSSVSLQNLVYLPSDSTNGSVSSSQTLILEDTNKTENEDTSLVRLGCLISDNFRFLGAIWNVLTTPIIEYPWVAAIGTIVGLYQRITHVYKQANVARLEKEEEYLRNTLDFFMSFHKLESMPGKIRHELSLAVDNINLNGGWAQFIQNEGIAGFKRVWASVLEANPEPPKDGETLAAVSDYDQYAIYVKDLVDDIESVRDLAYKNELNDLRASAFEINGVVKNIFPAFLNAVLFPSVVALASRSINWLLF